MLMTGVNLVTSAKKTGVTIDVVAGYKFMDQFIAGVGINGGMGDRYLKYTEGKLKGEGSKQGWNTLFDVMLRGRYLLFNKPNTPFVNLDLGLAVSNEYYYGLSYYDEEERYLYLGGFDIDKPKVSAVITPSVGYQYKVRKNVYLNGSFGYRIDTGVKLNGDDDRNARARVYSGGFQIKFGVNFML